MQSFNKIRNRFPLPGWLFILISVIFDEVILHLWTNPKIYPERLLVVTVFAIAFGLLLAFLISLLPVKIVKQVSTGLALLLAVLYVTEYFIDVNFHNFMSISMIMAGGGGVAGSFMHIVIDLIVNHVPHILLMLAPAVLCLLFAKRTDSSRKVCIGLGVGTAVCYAAAALLVACIPGYAAGLTTAYDFDTAVRSFSLNFSLPYEAYKSNSLSDNALEFESLELQAPTDAPVPKDTLPAEESPEDTVPPTEPPVVYGQNVLDIDFAQLAEEETRSSIAQLHQYVASQTPSSQNEYTGLFEGKNLIFITAEAFSGEFISPELTPTLYRMVTEGIWFQDYYQPVWGCGTIGGEYTNLVGLVPNDGGCMKEAQQQDLFLTIGNQLQKLGYSSAAYHNNDYTYYSRHKTHTYLGYDYFMGYGNGIEKGISLTKPTSDEEMFRYTIPMHLDEQPFSLYYMTVSGHADYSYKSHAIVRKHYDKVADLPYSDTVKGYIAANLDVETSMEYLLQTLEEQGITDDTVIVIATDHYPYGLSDKQLDELYQGDTSQGYIRDRSQLIIWSGCLKDKNIVVEEPTYSLDILPTLSNLFGVDFDSRLLPGRDVLSDAEPLVFWLDYNWKTDKGFYYARTSTFVPNEGVEVNEGYVESVCATVRNIITYSRAVAQNDYFNYLAPLLDQSESPPAE